MKGKKKWFLRVLEISLMLFVALFFMANSIQAQGWRDLLTASTTPVLIPDNCDVIYSFDSWFPLYSTDGYQWSYSPSYGDGYPLSYYNSYDGFGYQQSYNPYGYQQSFNPYGYEYQQPYNGYNLNQPYNYAWNQPYNGYNLNHSLLQGLLNNYRNQSNYSVGVDYSPWNQLYILPLIYLTIPMIFHRLLM